MKPFEEGTFVGRVWREDVKGPALVVVRDTALVDVTSPDAPTMRDLLEMENPVIWLNKQDGVAIADLQEVLAGHAAGVKLLSPCDLQAIKACGVTFAQSMLERVIEERAAGDPDTAGAIRKKIAKILGGSLREVKAGSAAAAKIKAHTDPRRPLVAIS